jgi:hypothetical protein
MAVTYRGSSQSVTDISSKGLNLNSVNQLIFVMVKCGVLFEVRTEFLNNTYTSYVFKGLMVKLGKIF